MSKNNPRNMPAIIEDAVIEASPQPKAKRQRRRNAVTYGAKRTDPYIPVGHPKFEWTTGADVQRTWRKYGWTPPSEKMTPPALAIGSTPAWALMVRRVK